MRAVFIDRTFAAFLLEKQVEYEDWLNNSEEARLYEYERLTGREN